MALARRVSGLRETSSVPRHPTTAVTPARVIFDRLISGVLVLGPPSPPPPRRWTWRSIKPGVTIFPDAGITSTLKAAGRAIRSYILAMILPTMRISFVPIFSGAYKVPPLINVNIDTSFIKDLI